MRLPLAHSLLVLALATPAAAQELHFAPTTFAQISQELAAPASPGVRSRGLWSQDTILPWHPQPKRFGTAMIDVGLSWLIQWAFNYYVRDAEFAHVGPDSWWENLSNP